MPSPKSGATSERYKEKNRKGRLAEGGVSPAAKMVLPRPRTVPELIGRGGRSPLSPPKKPAKILVKVTVLRSIGALNVVMPMESRVEDLIAAVVKQYVKECRRPSLESSEPTKFDLHYAQFSLESLDRKEKIVNLGSRNLFLCPKKGSSTAEGGASTWLKNSVGTHMTCMLTQNSYLLNKCVPLEIVRQSATTCYVTWPVRLYVKPVDLVV